MDLGSIILSKIATIQNMDVGYDPRKQTKKVGRWC